MKNGGKFKKGVICCLSGIIIGFINGIFGGGGGMITVPVLEHFIGLNVKKSHASAIFIILPLSIVSIITYFVNGSLELSGGLFVMFGVVCGGVIGSVLLKKLKSKWIAIIFAVIMIGAGAKLIF